MFIRPLSKTTVVGYAQSNLKSGATMATSQFINIGGTVGMPISSFLPVGDDTYNNVVIQTLDRVGRTVDSYGWTDAGGEDYDQTGWVDEDNNIVTEVTFQPGQGLWIYGSDASQGMQTAGQVGTSDVVVMLRSGATAAGNPFPIGVKIGDILPGGPDTYNNVVIQTLDRVGRTVDSYGWTDAGGEDYDQTGWVDEDNNIVTDVVFAPGQGLWVYGTDAQQTLTFPAPEL